MESFLNLQDLRKQSGLKFKEESTLINLNTTQKSSRGLMQERNIRAISTLPKKQSLLTNQKWNEMERNGTKWNDLERDGTNGTVIDIVIDNDIVNDIDTDTVTVCDSKVCVSNTGEFQETIFQEISDHNSNSKNKIPCSKNFSSFVQKECREILDYRGDSTLDDLTKAFQNYLLVAKMDTWKKSFTIRDFTRNVTEYLPEFFNPDKFKTSKTKQKQKQSASDIDAQIERLFSD